MRVTGKHSWLKHLDFIVIDLASLAIAFVVSFFLRFGSIEALFSPGWQGLLGILLLLNLTITFLMNPYSGIFRRAYYEDLLKMILQPTKSPDKMSSIVSSARSSVVTTKMFRKSLTLSDRFPDNSMRLRAYFNANDKKK